jgi:hypothetical protein
MIDEPSYAIRGGTKFFDTSSAVEYYGPRDEQNENLN